MIKTKLSLHIGEKNLVKVNSGLFDVSISTEVTRHPRIHLTGEEDVYVAEEVTRHPRINEGVYRTLEVTRHPRRNEEVTRHPRIF